MLSQALQRFCFRLKQSPHLLKHRWIGAGKREMLQHTTRIARTLRIFGNVGVTEASRP
jgi:hypothetical protein